MLRAVIEARGFPSTTRRPYTSIHDALNAIERRYKSYTPGLPAAPRASVDAAVAAAARQVLVQLIPDQAALVETAYVQALSSVRDGAAKTAGIATGQHGQEGTILRYVFFHSIALAVLVGLLVSAQAYLIPQIIPQIVPID